MTIAVGTSLDSARLNTKSPYDLAFWASSFIADGSPDDYFDSGPETDGLSMLTWSAGQVGIEMPDDYVTTLQLLTQNEIPIETALKTRGAILIGTTSLGVCMGLDDAICVVSGRYFQIRTTTSAWEGAGQLPGLIYS